MNLWEFSPPYYVPDHAWNSGEGPTEWRSWGKFVLEYGDAIPELHAICWQWCEGEDHDLPKYGGDPYYRGARLEIGMWKAGKGLYACHHIDVCRADEPAVREYLGRCWTYTRELWGPVVDA